VVVACFANLVGFITDFQTEEASDEGAESPPSKKKKKKKKHSKDKKDRESTSPEIEVRNNADDTRQSESPPLPSEEQYYGYDMYDDSSKYAARTKGFNSAEDYDNKSASYDHKHAMDPYGYHETYSQQDDDMSSGSDSYYSDFESHLAQYQNYKKQSWQEKSGKDEEEDLSDEDNYYSIGYNDTSRKQKRSHDLSHRPHKNRPAKNGDVRYDDETFHCLLNFRSCYRTHHLFSEYNILTGIKGRSRLQKTATGLFS